MREEDFLTVAAGLAQSVVFERGKIGCHLNCKGGWDESLWLLDGEHSGHYSLGVPALWQQKALW
jgi:hypothetical protein